MRKIFSRLPVLLAVLTLSQTALAQPPAVVAIVIDDIGYNHALAERALNLPGPVSYGILPALPHSAAYANEARAKNRDILLHLPMESMTENALGPGGMKIDMGAEEIDQVLQSDLQTVPGAIGISNHMGSRFTSDDASMRRFLGSMKAYGHQLLFVDSLTTSHTVGRTLAGEYGIPVLSRDIFLDNERSQELIGVQFDKLLELAKKRGRALAIAHPYPETLEFLEQRLHALKTGPVRLVPVSLLLNRTPEK